MASVDIVDILIKIQEEDEEKEKLDGAATICKMCRKNTYTGLRPFWHAYRRELCEECGKEYKEFLKKIGAWEV